MMNINVPRFGMSELWQMTWARESGSRSNRGSDSWAQNQKDIKNRMFVISNVSRHLCRLNSPAWCSRSARGCEWGWLELPGHQALPGPMWTDDWKTGPGSEEKKPNPGNIRLLVKTAERRQETFSLFTYLNWWGSGPVPGCVTGRAQWAGTDERRSRPADSSAGFCPDADEWWY